MSNQQLMQPIQIQPIQSWGGYNNQGNQAVNGNVLGGLGNVFGFSRSQTGPNTQYTGNELSNALMSSYTNDLNKFGHNTALKNMQTLANDMTGGQYTASLNNGKVSLIDSDGNTVSGSSVVGGSDGTSIGWNFGQAMSGIGNLANMGIGVTNAVMGWNQYKQNKELLNKNKELLEQQIEQNRENMEYTRKERARQDTMRSNVAAQRSSSSSVRSF